MQTLLDYDPAAARSRLLALVKERAYRDDVDIVLASGKRSTFYVNGKKITLDAEGLFLFAYLLLEQLRDTPEVSAIGNPAVPATRRCPANNRIRNGPAC